MDILVAAVTLFLIMDSLGCIPIFLSILAKVPEERQRFIIMRELIIAYITMVLFLLLGPFLLKILGLSSQAVSIGGGLVLMIIALRMIFPLRGGSIMGDEDDIDGEPLVVPLAIPLIAGPSILATLILLRESHTISYIALFFALTIAWVFTAIVLVASPQLYKMLGNRGLKAMERLMGMILICISVQMLLNAFLTLFK